MKFKPQSNRSSLYINNGDVMQTAAVCLDHKIGFLGLGFSVVGVWGLRCGAFWIFGLGLYINMKDQ